MSILRRNISRPALTRLRFCFCGGGESCTATFQRQARRCCKSANDAERAERGRINAGSDRQKMIALIARDCGAGKWSHFTVDGVGVITLLLEYDLHTGD